MRLLRCTAIAAVLMSISLLAAGSATAATEVGNSCVANASVSGGFTFLQLAKSGAPPIAAPSAGVVTKWKVSVITFESSVGETLKVFRPTADPDQFQLVGESEMGTVVSGQNTFDTRIPVQAGDRFGVTGSSIGTLFCNTGPGDTMGVFEGNIPSGGTATFKKQAKEAQAAVSAVIEPDIDNDGYGDETQDKCPQSAASQVACPILLLDAIAQPPGKSAVRILVASSTQAAIVVSASAKLPGESKKARVSAQVKLAPIDQLVTPGKIAIYALNFKKSLKDALAALPAKKTLKLKVVASGKGLDGSASTDTLTVKLKGQAP